MLWVCPLRKVEETVLSVKADRLVTLLAPGSEMRRPGSIGVDGHLALWMHDVAVEADGMDPPGEAHVARLIDFAERWDRRNPMVIHCYAGISRSTAAAFIVAATLSPDRDEDEIADTLRRRSPTATPNLRLVGLADTMLGRNGRMAAAAARIGRGTEAMEGIPFELPL
jgi:predicted protein tyrosine phosphatase